MRYLVKLSYDGAEFFGWQIQPDRPSVQGTLEKALGTLLRNETPVTGAGRTDTGVNAICYVAHFDCDVELDLQNFCRKLNAILPHSISVLCVEKAEEGFHSRFDAINREYTYFLHRVKDPFVEGHSCLYTYPGLDFELMNKAARLLVGRHDFRCFEKSGTDCKTSICTISEAYWTQYTPVICASGVETGADGVYWYFRISADRFLRNMVRAVVGTLLEVGRGKRSLEDFASLVLAADEDREKSVMRCAAGESAPGHALFLTSVKY